MSHGTDRWKVERNAWRDDLLVAGNGMSAPDRWVGHLWSSYVRPSGWAAVSMGRLAQQSGYCRRTVLEALQHLEEAGRIEARRRQGQTTRYRLVPVPEMYLCRRLTPPCFDYPQPVQETHRTCAGDSHKSSTRPPPITNNLGLHLGFPREASK